MGNHRLAEVFQPVAAEGPDHDGVLEQLDRRLREQDLAAVSRGRDSGGPVHVDPAVLPADDERLAGMEPHPDAEVAAGKRVLRRRGGRERLARAGKGGEEAVALGAELDAVAGGHLLPQDVAVVGQRVAVPLGAELLQKDGRPLDVGEQQRDRACGKLSHDPRGMIIKSRAGREGRTRPADAGTD